MPSPFVEYFKEGETDQKGRVGLEAEHFILSQTTGMPMGYDDLRMLMGELEYPKKTYEDGHLIQLEKGPVLVTLEPGCQIELSFACTDNVNEIMKWYIDAMVPIMDIADSMGYDIFCSGGLPTEDPRRMPRILKKRYQFMENWFASHGTRGQEMMKGTASNHVSVDYASEQDFVNKYRMANILHPLLQFLSANTPHYAGKKNEDILLRDAIWAETDPARCGIIPGLFDEDFGYDAYGRWLEQLPLITMHEGEEYIDAEDLTIAQGAEKWGWEEPAISHYLSMAFPDIRLKKFIEIRSADIMPLPWMMAYTALIKGLFYDQDMIDKINALAHSTEEIQAAKDAIRKDGWEAEIYGQKLMDLTNDLLAAAEKNLPETEKQLLNPLKIAAMEKKHIYEYTDGRTMAVLR